MKTIDKYSTQSGAWIMCLLLVLGCSKPVVFEEPVDTFTLDFSEYAPPETTNLPTTVTESNKYAWDEFAWQTFIALNWPAVEPTKSNGYLRGYPDPTKTFKEVASYPDAPLVWETLKEKREVFNHDATSMEAAEPGPWSSDYNYGGSSPLGAHKKRVYATSKFATLDETVQVQAEAREPYYKTSKPEKYGNVTVARTFRGTMPSNGNPGPGNAIRYEVKVNYDFFKYVVDNGFYYDPMTYARTKSPVPVQLPWRSSASIPSLPNGNAQKSGVAGLQSYVDNYKTKDARIAYQNGISSGTGATPPRIGSIHIKAAWAPIQESERSRFIAREAEYYEANSGATTGLFGLVGLHIIQRIKTDGANGLGGSFVFSTWEHKEIREDMTNTTYNDSLATKQYTYTNYFTLGQVIEGPTPALTNPFYVSRLYPILDHTKEANDKFTEMVGANSVWSNYRLVGTQFKPVDLTTDSNVTGGGQSASDPFVADDPAKNDQEYEPVFLANLVIETNVGLQQFQGQPPLLAPVHNYMQVKGTTGTPVSAFDRTGKNILFQGTQKNMGGCMGCHGVSQLNGYSFSFVLLGGQAGADPDSEQVFLEPLGNRNSAPDPIIILESGVPLNGGFKNAALATATYLNDRGGSAVVSTTATTLVITNMAKGYTYEGAPFQYGDKVKIMDKNSGEFLAVSGTGDLSFNAQGTELTIYNPSVDASEQNGYILRLDNIAFQYDSKFLGINPTNTTLTFTPTLNPYTNWDLERF